MKISKKLVAILIVTTLGAAATFAEGWYSARLKGSNNGASKGNQLYYYYFDDAGKIKRIGNVKTDSLSMTIEYEGMPFSLFKKDRETEEKFISWCNKKKVKYEKVSDLSTLPDWAKE